jgi:hypothetical protein
MATRFKATDLKEMIRSIVREEMLTVTKQAINEVLSERYLKQLAEVAASRPRGVGRTMHIADGDDQEVEEAPHPLDNPTQGIYTRHPSKHDDGVDDEDDQNFERSTPRLTPEGRERNEMLSLFFEGTKPLKEIEERVEEGIPLERMQPPPMPQNGGRRPMNEVWKELAGVGKSAPKQASLDKAELEKREEMRLKMLRESLEKPAQ